MSFLPLDVRAMHSCTNAFVFSDGLEWTRTLSQSECVALAAAPPPLRVPPPAVQIAVARVCACVRY